MFRSVTLSVVAFDPVAGTVGAAVTSCVIAAGPRILHVRPDVGAAVAQAHSEITWGDEILDRMAAGQSATEAIVPYRLDEIQVAATSVRGTIAVHTGESCPPHANHVIASNVSFQVNTARLTDAPARMVEAFESSSGPLAERLVAALAASGGDARGHQSAAVVVAGSGPPRGYEDEPHVDLRVDDHRSPVDELARLLSLHRAHCVMRSLRDLPAEHQVSALTPLVAEHPGDPHLKFWLEAARDAS